MIEIKNIKESLSQNDVIDICLKMKNDWKIDFVVVGGSAYTLYANLPTNDLDVVVYDKGKLYFNHKDDHRKWDRWFDTWIGHPRDGSVDQFILKGLPVHFVPSGVIDPRREYGVEEIRGVEVLSLASLIKHDLIGLKGVKELDLERKGMTRVEKVILRLNLDLEFIEKLDNEQARRKFLIAWESANNVEFEVDKAREIIKTGKV